jgi:hypothetical protein
MTQLPDGRPGFYYVTAREHGGATGRTALLFGPFEQRTPGLEAHRRALGAVQLARRLTVAIFAARDTGFASFGTSRLPLEAAGRPPAGKLNRLLEDEAARAKVLR